MASLSFPSSLTRPSLLSQRVSAAKSEPSVVLIQSDSEDSEVEAGYDTDLDALVRKEEFDVTGRSQYLDACQYYGIVPAHFFLRHMMEPQIIMHHHSLGIKGVKAIAMALQTSTKVLTLDLDDNMMEGEGGASIASIVKDNCYIAELNVSNNDLRSRGAAALGDMLMSNTTLQVLKASGNHFKDADGVHFAKSLYENFSLRVLDLSNNDLGEETAKSMGPALKENDTLEEIDFSFNHFRTKGALILCSGIKDSPILKRVNLSFNGFGDECAIGIAKIITDSKHLIDLDVSSTRIGNIGAQLISEALKQNQILRSLWIKNNPLGTAGSLAIINGIAAETSNVVFLDLSFMAVDKEFINIKKELVERRNVEVSHGYVIGDHVIKEKVLIEADHSDDVPALLFGVPCLELNSSNLFTYIKLCAEQMDIDFTELLCEADPLNVNKVIPSDIMKVLEKSGIHVHDDHRSLVIGLLKELVDDDGLVIYSEMVTKKKNDY